MSQNIHSYRLVVTKCLPIAARPSSVRLAALTLVAASTALIVSPVPFARSDQVALRYAELTYYGQWFHPLREALQAFIDHTNATVTGTAKVRLFKGRAMQIGATSPHSLYDPQLASFSMENFEVTDAIGFIRLFGLPMKVASQRKRW